MTNETNKPLRTARYVQIILVALMFIAGAVVYSRLPDMLPVHWGFNGEPNNWWPKMYGTWFIPALAALFVILFPILQRVDPKSQNYPGFAKAWAVIQTSILAMLAYAYGVSLFVAIYPAYNALVGRLVVFGVGLLFVVLGNYMGKVRQNYFVGLRTPWTLNDPEVWQKSQRLSGWAFVLAGLLILIESIVWVGVAYVFFGIIVLMVVVPMVYSYLLSRKKRS
ncbi:MAG: SdpI family protein [Patescibacteria group bacterium]|nr:SdpI family protein [Patescibacteria group bacterium]